MAALCRRRLATWLLKQKLFSNSSMCILSQTKYKYWGQFSANRNLSTLSATFNSKPSYKFQFKLSSSVGLFQVEELTDFSGFHLLKQQTEAQVEVLVREITSDDRTRSIVAIFDELSDCLCRVADLAEFVRVSHPDNVVANAAEEACLHLSGVVEKLNTNPDIYYALKHAVEQGDVVPMDAIDKRVGELFVFDHEQSGVHLSEDKRKAFVQLSEDTLMLGNFFMHGAHNARTIPSRMLPDGLRHYFSIDGEHAQVSGLLSDHFNEAVREASYKVYMYPDPHQQHLFDSLLATRHKLAQVVGFETFAHRTIKGTMAETPENVMDFLETLAHSIKSKADADYVSMLHMKKSEGGTGERIMAWDVPYYTARGKQQFSNMNSYEISSYFSLGSCMDGLSNLYKCLFNITLQDVPLDRGEAWTSDIRKLAVIHETEGTLGFIYCDFFERPSKPLQDSHYTIQGGRQKQDGEYQLPIVVLQLNFSAPRSNAPTLLTHSTMENLFHEFGHAMHSMLARTKYQHITGTRCPTDFAEVPSVLMEYFVSDPRVLATFARHYKTGESLPMEDIEKMCRAKRMYSASEMQLQVFYSITDQVIHSRYPFDGNKNITEMMAELQEKYYSIPYTKNTAWHLRFGHFVGYGAKYYSYLLSRGVAARIWHNCFKHDPFNRQMGERYREEMMSHGGGKPPGQLVQAMLQEPEQLSMNQLVESLVQDLDSIGDTGKEIM